MGMLRRGIAAFANTVGGQLEKDYESNRETAAKKDLMSFESELRQKFQEAQNKWASGERVAGQEFQAGQAVLGREHQSTEARLGREHQSAEGDKNRAIQRGQLDEMSRHNQAQEANSRSQLAIARRQLDNAEKVKDLPASVKAELDFLKAQATAAEKALGEASTDEQRAQARSRVDAITLRVQGLIGSSPKSPSFDPNKPAEAEGKKSPARQQIAEDPAPAKVPGTQADVDAAINQPRADTGVGMLKKHAESVTSEERKEYDKLIAKEKMGHKLTSYERQQLDRLKQFFSE